MPTISQLEPDQQLTVFGPARVSYVADEAPVVSALDPPTIDGVSPNTAPAGDPTPIVMTVTGTGFRSGSKITFNGYSETTVFVSDTELTTIVQPSLFVVPAVCPVGVRTGGLTSSTLDFTFT